MDIDDAIGTAGARLRALRRDRGMTLAQVEEATGISTSTLSRLESGGRRATLELLLPLARVYGTTLDELVRPPGVPDPRVRARPIRRDGMTMLPLTRHASGLQAYKMVLPPGRRTVPQPRTHEGYEWLYVLSGRLRLVLGDTETVLEPGEAAEFDTRMPHWFGTQDGGSVEMLSLFGAQGERAHVRASTVRRD
ncbi:XRE family transcriptional regulator [Leifsonia sp. C5G2]|uniref:XRE family transcriptional regulator n=1 Tax=Leifsonia sp. C5G2 TaxID=2735269 RepID=UPI0015854C75|nr:XRE family transcriptional regulator [Leifsonia sp. C5G2]NUU07980.1 helix-turn-helix transcriptional regulator [Leifsonia sp. C5G2]